MLSYNFRSHRAYADEHTESVDITPEDVSKALALDVYRWLMTTRENTFVRCPPTYQEIPVTTDQQLHVQRATASSGWGIFAKADIPFGQRILVETPFLCIEGSGTDVNSSTVEWQSLEQALFDLASHDWSTFRSLSNAFEAETGSKFASSPLLGRIQTNGIQVLSKTGHRILVFGTTSRFNHSCKANANFAWNDITQRGSIFALRDIREGEEITLNYGGTAGTFAERQMTLKERYNFDCLCELCSLDQASRDSSDERRKEIKKLHRTFGKNAHGEFYPSPDLSTGERMIQLIDQEGVREPRISDVSVLLSKITLFQSDLARAIIFTRHYGSLLMHEAGLDNPALKEWCHMLHEPEKSPFYGISSLRKTTRMDMPPPGVTPTTAIQWTWQEPGLQWVPPALPKTHSTEAEDSQESSASDGSSEIGDQQIDELASGVGSIDV